MPYNQKDLPLIFDLAGPGFFSLGGFSIPLPFLMGSSAGIIRPELFDLQRPARGAVINTAGSAFLDDFGRGAPYLLLEGHTGWGRPEGLAGITSLKLLEAIFIEYLQRRKRVAAAGGGCGECGSEHALVLPGPSRSARPVAAAGVGAVRGSGHEIFLHGAVYPGAHRGGAVAGGPQNGKE